MKWTQIWPCGSVASVKPGSLMSRMPLPSDRISAAPAPVRTRTISSVRLGCMVFCAPTTIGTRRTMPSRSGAIVKRPRPPGRGFEHRDVGEEAGVMEQVRPHVGAERRETRGRQACDGAQRLA